ncbi:hypothetical protein XENTR_v10023141 [Xenopus tropicalis]|nr:hypothetical protein XENTR_v10023141 [Xenopus tropicalis]
MAPSGTQLINYLALGLYTGNPTLGSIIPGIINPLYSLSEPEAAHWLALPVYHTYYRSCLTCLGLPTPRFHNISPSACSGGKPSPKWLPASWLLSLLYYPTVPPTGRWYCNRACYDPGKGTYFSLH